MDANIAELCESLGATLPDRECIVTPTRRLTWRQFLDRSHQLANLLADRGFGAHTERDELAHHESGQDHLAVYLRNGNEYLEAMVGAYGARVVPYNVNYRYVADELRYLLDSVGCRGIVYDASFAPVLADVLGDLNGVELLLQVDDGSGNELLPGALDYEAALAAASPALPACAPDWSPDDLYVICTGGTTGMPKGVAWRQADVAVVAMGARDRTTNAEWAGVDDLVAAARATVPEAYLSAAPFMHGAGQWTAFTALFGGHTVVIQSAVDRLDPADLLTTVERERVSTLLIVGDAFARPIVDELDRCDYDVSSLRLVVSAGAALTPQAKSDLLACVPGLAIRDSLGSSEAGGQASNVSRAGVTPTTGAFEPRPGVVVIDEHMTEVVTPGHAGDGWMASIGRIPLGYLGDAEKTARTFPTLRDGTRASVPGDRARHREDGSIEVLGRDSVTINTGGEKVFAEEVEAAIMTHPGVLDTVVVGRPDPRWGSEIVALVRLRDGAVTTGAEVTSVCRERLARYKVPKQVLLVDEIVRSPAGKADYRWAKQLATTAVERV
jgi:fatty-acyl-CoA synthase